jgi:hypothetical protein
MTAKPIKPFARGRRRSAGEVAKGIRGHCYDFAARDVLAWAEAGRPEPAPMLVHGIARSSGVPYDHAWIERGGFAYDWQLVVEAKGHPMLVDEYRRVHGSEDRARFTAEEAVAKILSVGHYGPWEKE